MTFVHGGSGIIDSMQVIQYKPVKSMFYSKAKSVHIERICHIGEQMVKEGTT